MTNSIQYFSFKTLFPVFRNFLVIALSISFTTCDLEYTDCDTYDFSDCTIDEPFEAELIMKISNEPEYDSIRVILFKGVIDSRDTIDNFIAEYDEYFIWRDIDEEYSAIAQYYIDNKTITVVDGDKLRSKLTSRCDEACYIIKGDELNLQLEFNNIN